ncbi:NmrA family NAD(P)-binding protein [Sphingobium salicis]
MTFDTRPILVLGATGAQGGGVVRALLGAGTSVRAFVRDATSADAKALEAAGAILCEGDMDDRASLDRAVAGAKGAFSVQVASIDSDYELRTGRAIIDAAYEADVDMFVHTSVARAGDHTAFTGWDEGRWGKAYWENKAAVNEAVRERGFKRYVILKPAFMMENFALPRSTGMFLSLAQGRLDTAYLPDTRIHLIGAADIGAFALAAFAGPDRFHGAEIDLAAEALTMEEIADALAAGTGQPVAAQSLSAQEAVRRGMREGVAQNQLWANEEGYKVDIQALPRWGVPLRLFFQLGRGE